MRALRILLIVVVILGGLFVAADRVAVVLRGGEAADRIKSSEGLSADPRRVHQGLPLPDPGRRRRARRRRRRHQPASTRHRGRPARSGSTDAAGRAARRRRQRRLQLRHRRPGHRHRADLVRRAAEGRQGRRAPRTSRPGVTAQVTGLSDGGDGKIKVTGSRRRVLGSRPPHASRVLSTVTVSRRHGQGARRLAARAGRPARRGPDPVDHRLRAEDRASCRRHQARQGRGGPGRLSRSR